VSFVAALGLAGQACFFSRFLVQWWQSERAGRSVVPPLFWWLSVAGSTAVGVYAFAQQRHVLLVGYALNAVIYARNIAFQRGSAQPVAAGTATVVALFTAAALSAAALVELSSAGASSPAWIALAGVGQFLWSARFVLQWWASERAAHSHFPRSFWWISLAGNVLLLAYTIHLRDAVFIIGLVLGPLVQVRNLMLGRASADRGAS